MKETRALVSSRLESRVASSVPPRTVSECACCNKNHAKHNFPFDQNQSLQVEVELNFHFFFGIYFLRACVAASPHPQQPWAAPVE